MRKKETVRTINAEKKYVKRSHTRKIGLPLD